MSQESNRNTPSANQSSSSATIIVASALALIVVLLVLLRPMCPPPPRPRQGRVGCMANLKQVGLELLTYGGEHGEFGPADKWCDLLADQYSRRTGKRAGKFRQSFHCPKVDKDEWGYAMNPLADRWSAGDVVLLFESDAGWNGSGGPEALTTGRLEDGRCTVFRVDGTTLFVRRGETERLRWQGQFFDGTELAVPPASNSRRIQTTEEMEYWLRNMIWHHQFSKAEVQAATGLKPSAVLHARWLCAVDRAGRPPREANAPLLVLPYPGGRHPRIGFLEGAIDPQRETKFSVFTPWDPNSYVVVDVPEAIWSNLGLTYLAHTHIDAIWTKQGIDLPKFEWNRRPDGSLDIERTLPNGIAFGAKAVADREAVHMEMWLHNGTNEKLSDLRVQICVMPKMAKGFAALTNDNKVLTHPYVACRSEDGKRWIITAWESCHRPWANPDCPCFHSDPKFPDLDPGQKARLRGWLSFYEGDDVQAEFRRIEATGWRED